MNKFFGSFRLYAIRTFAAAMALISAGIGQQAFAGNDRPQPGRGHGGGPVVTTPVVHGGGAGASATSRATAGSVALGGRATGGTAIVNGGAPGIAGGSGAPVTGVHSTNPVVTPLANAPQVVMVGRNGGFYNGEAVNVGGQPGIRDPRNQGTLAFTSNGQVLAPAGGGAWTPAGVQMRNAPGEQNIGGYRMHQQGGIINFRGDDGTAGTIVPHNGGVRIIVAQVAAQAQSINTRVNVEVEQQQRAGRLVAAAYGAGAFYAFPAVSNVQIVYPVQRVEERQVARPPAVQTQRPPAQRVVTPPARTTQAPCDPCEAFHEVARQLTATQELLIRIDQRNQAAIADLRAQVVYANEQAARANARADQIAEAFAAETHRTIPDVPQVVAPPAPPPLPSLLPSPPPAAAPVPAPNPAPTDAAPAPAPNPAPTGAAPAPAPNPAPTDAAPAPAPNPAPTGAAPAPAPNPAPTDAAPAPGQQGSLGLPAALVQNLAAHTVSTGPVHVVANAPTGQAPGTPNVPAQPRDTLVSVRDIRAQSEDRVQVSEGNGFWSDLGQSVKNFFVGVKDAVVAFIVGRAEAPAQQARARVEPMVALRTGDQSEVVGPYGRREPRLVVAQAPSQPVAAQPAVNPLAERMSLVAQVTEELHDMQYTGRNIDMASKSAAFRAAVVEVAGIMQADPESARNNYRMYAERRQAAAATPRAQAA